MNSPVVAVWIIAGNFIVQKTSYWRYVRQLVQTIKNNCRTHFDGPRALNNDRNIQARNKINGKSSADHLNFPSFAASKGENLANEFPGNLFFAAECFF